jgi:UDP:flavonoid glycosyltransferase YjiC (YdhE family)
VSDDGVEDYRALVQELAARGVRIVYVTYPMYEPAYEPNKAAYDRYLAAMRKWMPPAPIIDFNEPQYSSFRADAANFIDAVHLSASGSAQFSDMLRIQVAQALSAK